MAFRQFVDSRGITWEVWEVEPSRAERRSGRDRRRTKRDDPDRRRSAEDTPRARISSEFTRGWLCFQTQHEKRRLSPVPEGWESVDEASLEGLCAQARPVGKPRRLIE